MNEGPRRRRPVFSEPPRTAGEFPLVPAIIVVILVGLFLGAAFAHYLAAPKVTANKLVTVRPTPLPTTMPTPPPEQTPPPQSPSPKPTATANAALSPSPHPAATRAVTPSPRPQSTPTALASAAPAKTASPKPISTATPRPVATATPVLKHTLPVARATENTSGAAANVVRSYIDALRSGRPQAAASYLAGGTPDQDSFVDAGARISSLSSSRNANGTYHVDANVVTASGTYSMSFTVSASNRITDHVGVKIH